MTVAYTTAPGVTLTEDVDVTALAWFIDSGVRWAGRVPRRAPLSAIW